MSKLDPTPRTISDNKALAVSKVRTTLEAFFRKGENGPAPTWWRERMEAVLAKLPTKDLDVLEYLACYAKNTE